MMLSRLLFGKTKAPILETALNVYVLRHKAIANNIGNISTPGYRRTEVHFEEKLREAMDKPRLQGRITRPDHIPIGVPEPRFVRPRVVEPEDPVLHSGVNNVDIDREMTELAKNQIRYAYAARLITRTFNSLKASITGKVT